MSPSKETVRKMFDAIAPNYDLLNHVLSFGIDRSWRKRLVREIRITFPDNLHQLYILDLATGTGDLALAVAALKPASILGVDISLPMMEIGRKKTVKRQLDSMITFREGEAESLPAESGFFDVVMVAFGVRNFSDLTTGIKEMKRVLKPGGKMMILEFSHPDRFPLKQLYRFYSVAVIPVLGRWISRHNQAYRYLPETVAAFPYGESFLQILRNSCLSKCRQIRLSGGIASLYIAEK